MARKINKQLVKLRKKKIANGYLSLYLDTYQNGNRDYEFLNIYVKENPRTPEERIDNSEKIKLAEKIRSEREYNLQHEKFGLPSPRRNKIDFIDYYQKYLDEYPNKDDRIVRYSLEKLKDFIGKNSLSPKEVTSELLINFKRYLEKHLNGETPHNYFSKLKQVCKKAKADGLFAVNPAEGIMNTRQEGLKKNILSEDEIAAMAKAKCSNEEVKRAFLFTCFTGLRHSDVKALKWKDIDNGKLKKFQEKTNRIVYIDLSSTAQKLLGDREGQDDFIFNLPSISYSLRAIKDWAKGAGIDKNITWHSSRHSFAVNLLVNRNDIKTVSHLLGHTSLKHTEKYLRVIDELNEKAVNSLKPLEI